MSSSSHSAGNNQPSVWSHFGVTCIVLLTLCASSVAAFPVPESREELSRFERQRVRFLNATPLRQAHEQVAREAYADAERSLQTVINNDPGNNHARMMLINVQNQLGNYEGALEQVEDLLAYYPEVIDLYLERAFIRLRSGQEEEAIRDLEHFIRRAPPTHPRFIEAGDNLAEVLFRKRRFAAAADVVRDLIEIDDTVTRRMFVAECAIQQARWDEAIPELQTALQLNPVPVALPQILTTLGNAQFQLAEYEQAVSTYTDALNVITEEQQRAQLQVKRGYSYYKLGNYRRADEAFAEAQTYFQQPPERLEILHQRGLIAFHDGRPEDAVRFYQQRLEYEFDEEVALALLDALQQADLIDEAIRVAREYDEASAGDEVFRTTVTERRLNWYMLRDQHERLYATALSLHETTQEINYLRIAAAAAERLDRWDDAAAYYRRYLASNDDPNTSLALYYVLQMKVSRADDDYDAQERIESLLAESGQILQHILVHDEVSEEDRRVARYELAQVSRQQGDMDTYFLLMQEIVDESPEGRFLFEYAVQLYGAQRLDEAMPLLEESVELLDESEQRYLASSMLADIHLQRNQPQDAIHWLERAAAFAPPDRPWQLARARADFKLQQYSDVLERLLPIAEDDDVFNMYIAFSFNNKTPAMPGLALTFMNRIQDPDRLGNAEQFNFFANRAYLHFDQLRDEATRADIVTALHLSADLNLELVRLRSLLRQEDFAAVIEGGYQLLDSAQDDAIFQAQIYEVMGLAASSLENWHRAVRYFTAAIDHDSSLLQARYQRGLAFFRLGEIDQAEADLMGLEEYADLFPATFWGDLAFVLGHLGEYELGTEWLNRSLAMFPYDIDAWQERGYQSMKDYRNPDARESFKTGIVLYNEVIPYVESADEAETYTISRTLLKEEYTKLAKRWSFQVYGQRTDFDFDTADLLDGVPGDSTQGALQSQGGISIGFRPPKIGFRNERTFDTSLRVLWNFDPNSWRPDSDSYQGGIGITYKPFIRQNYLFGFERLFKIGDNAEDNWLWRNTYGIEAGERPPRGEDLWLYRRFYGEISYYLQSPQRWIFFGQGNIGPTLRLPRDIMLTIPEALLVGRYQDNDPEGVGSYWYYGLGLNLRVLEGEREFTRDRWTANAYAHYVWGRFTETPEIISDTDFEGWIIGVNFTR